MRPMSWPALLVALAFGATGCALSGSGGEPSEAFTIVPGEGALPGPVEGGGEEGDPGHDRPAPVTDLAGLTQSWGCGNGWAVSNADQTVGLLVYPRGGDEAPVPESSPVAPDGYWTVELRFGRDLFANWCDDVIEPGEPEPSIERTFVGVGGELVLASPVDPDRFACPQTVTVEVTDLVVAEGETTIDLGSGELTNESWGCFAG